MFSFVVPFFAKSFLHFWVVLSVILSADSYPEKNTKTPIPNPDPSGMPKNFHGMYDAINNVSSPLRKRSNYRTLVSVSGGTGSSGKFLNQTKIVKSQCWFNISDYYSTAAASEQSRTTFAKNLVDFIVKNGFDGADLLSEIYVLFSSLNFFMQVHFVDFLWLLLWNSCAHFRSGIFHSKTILHFLELWNNWCFSWIRPPSPKDYENYGLLLKKIRETLLAACQKGARQNAYLLTVMIGFADEGISSLVASVDFFNLWTYVRYFILDFLQLQEYDIQKIEISTIFAGL